MTRRPDNCCVAGCGRPTQSHNIAIDVSEHDVIGMPTLAGVVCHRCWVGGTDSAPPVPEMLEAAGDDVGALLERFDRDRMVLVGAPTAELAGGDP